MKRNSKKLVALLLVTMLMVLAGCSSNSKSSGEEKESEYPTKAVEVIIGWSAGGDTDVNFRTISPILEKKFGQSFNITCEEGGNSSVAMAAHVNDEPDGYNLMVTLSGSMCANSATGLSEVGLDDYDVVSCFGEYSGDLLMVPADAPFDDIDGLIEYTKKNPSTIATSIGGASYIAVVAMQQEGADLTIVESTSSAERLTQLLGGHVDICMAPLAQASEYIESGDMKAICTFADSRSILLPEVETAAEQGYEDLSQKSYYIVLAPKGTPEDIVKTLSDAFYEAANSDEFAEQYETFNGVAANPLTLEESISTTTNLNDTFLGMSKYLK